jgi:hypothetical protein
MNKIWLLLGLILMYVVGVISGIPAGKLQHDEIKARPVQQCPESPTQEPVACNQCLKQCSEELDGYVSVYTKVNGLGALVNARGGR